MELFSCQPLTEQQHRIRNQSGGSATRDTKTSIHNTRLANTNSSIPKATREPSQESVYLTASSRATLLSLGKISISSSHESMKPIFKVPALNPQKACVSADGYRHKLSRIPPGRITLLQLRSLPNHIILIYTFSCPLSIPSSKLMPFLNLYK